MMPAAFDTNALIWGVKKEATPGQEEMILRMAQLLHDLAAQKEILYIPAHSVAEYVGSFPTARRAEQFRLIGEKFRIAPFDARAAEVAADILHDQVFNVVVRTKHREETGQVREHMKADVAIVATAIACGADRIYLHDDRARKFAEGRIKVVPIPRLRKSEHQKQMFGDD